MHELKGLVNALAQYGYTVAEDNVGASGFLFCTITGGALEGAEAIIRANKEVCNAGIVLGLFDVVPVNKQLDLSLSLLELNFGHPLARISLYKSPEEPGEYMRLVVAETSFFWTPPDEHRFNLRMRSLYSISSDASKALSQSGPLPKSNPFFERYRPERDPIQRSHLDDGEGIDSGRVPE